MKHVFIFKVKFPLSENGNTKFMEPESVIKKKKRLML